MISYSDRNRGAGFLETRSPVEPPYRTRMLVRPSLALSQEAAGFGRHVRRDVEYWNALTKSWNSLAPNSRKNQDSLSFHGPPRQQPTPRVLRSQKTTFSIPPPPPDVPPPRRRPRKSPPLCPPQILLKHKDFWGPSFLALRSSQAAGEDNFRNEDSKDRLGHVQDDDRSFKVASRRTARSSDLIHELAASAIPRGCTPEAAELASIIEQSRTTERENTVVANRKTIDHFDDLEIAAITKLVLHLSILDVDSINFMDGNANIDLSGLDWIENVSDFDLYTFTPNQIFYALIARLKGLQKPLINEDIVSDLLFIYDTQPDNLKEIRNIIIFGVTPGKKKLLKHVMRFLGRLSKQHPENASYPSTLSKLLAPCILSTYNGPNRKIAIRLFDELIENCDSVFGDLRPRRGEVKTPIEEIINEEKSEMSVDLPTEVATHQQPPETKSTWKSKQGGSRLIRKLLPRMPGRYSKKDNASK